MEDQLSPSDTQPQGRPLSERQKTYLINRQYSKFFAVLIVLGLGYLFFLGQLIGLWAPASGVPPYGLDQLTAYRLVGWMGLLLAGLIALAIWRILILGIRRVHDARR